MVTRCRAKRAATSVAQEPSCHPRHNTAAECGGTAAVGTFTGADRKLLFLNVTGFRHRVIYSYILMGPGTPGPAWCKCMHDCQALTASGRTLLVGGSARVAWLGKVCESSRRGCLPPPVKWTTPWPVRCASQGDSLLCKDPSHQCTPGTRHSQFTAYNTHARNNTLDVMTK